MNAEVTAKSRISGDRALKLQREWRERISDIFTRAMRDKLTSEDITDMVNQHVRLTNDWKRVAGHVQTYIQGYLDAKRDNIRHHLAWLKWCDGKLMTTAELDALEKEELVRLGIKMKDGVFWREGPPATPAHDYKSPWARVDNDKSRHVWIDDDGNPLRNKPYDRKWAVKV